MQNMQIKFDYKPIDFVLEIESNTTIQQIIQPKPKLEINKTRLPLIESYKIQYIQQHTIMKTEKVKKYEITSKYDITTVFKLDITQCCLFKPNARKKIKLMKYDVEMFFNDNKKQIKAKMALKKYENVLIFEMIKINFFEISCEAREIKLTETITFNMNNLKEYEEIYLTLKRSFRIEEIEEDSDLLFVINGKNYIKQSLSKLLYELENEIIKRK